MTKNFCPVCGFNLMPYHGEKSSDGDICFSCGFQFSYFGMAFMGTDKEEVFYSGYRTHLILSGKKWSSTSDELKPKDWNPDDQLRNIGFQH